MVQIGTPDSNPVNNNWTHVGAGQFQRAIDEGFPHDSDTSYIRNTSGTNDAQVGLSALTDPVVDTDHVIKVAVRSTLFSIPPSTVTIGLYVDSGATLVAEFSANLTLTYQIETYTLSAGEAALLAGKYNDLRLQFETSTPGTDIAQTRITVAQLEIPDVPAETEMRTTSVALEVSSRYVPEGTVTPLALPAVTPNLLAHNWDGLPLDVETSYMTDVTESAETETEERVVLRDRPTRTVRPSWFGVDRNVASKALMNLARLQHTRLPLPLYCDFTRLDAEYTAGNVLSCDTKYLRFYKGARILVVTLDGCEMVNGEYAEIDSLTDSSITMKTPLVASQAVGVHVFPLLDCEIRLRSDTRLLTDEKSTSRVLYTEVVGPSSLPPSADDTLDSVSVIHNGIPVFVFPENWRATVNTRMVRAGAAVPLGRGGFVAIRGDRPRFIYTVTVSFADRKTFWEVLQFFDSRRGRGRTFIVDNPQTLYKVVAITTTHVDVEEIGNIEDHQEFFEKVFIELDDGTPIIRDISSIVATGGNWRFNFTSPLDAADVPALADVRRVTSGHLVRMFSDSMRELWTTNTAGEVTFQMIDLPNEQDVSIADVLDPVTFGSEINLPSLFLWASAAKNVSRAPGASPSYPQFARDRLISGFEQPEQMASFIDDARVNGPEVYAKGLVFPEPYLGHHDIASGAGVGPFLQSFSSWKQNRGRDICECPLNSVAWDMVFQNHAKWWDDAAGFTIFWCGRLTKKGGANDDHVLFWDGSQTQTDPEGFALATNWFRIGIFNQPFTSIASKADRFYVLRWDPGVSVHVYRSGVQKVFFGTSVPTTIVKPDTYTQVHTGVAPDSESDIDSEKHIGQSGFFNEFLAFRKALTNVEMNLVGNYLAKLYPSFWTDIT